MSTTIPPLVCDTPPPIDELEDISGDEDISVGANSSNFEHFEDETPSPSPSYHHHDVHNSIFSTTSIPAVEDISSELNEMNPQLYDAESIEQMENALPIECPISPSSDTANEMTFQNDSNVLESKSVCENSVPFVSLHAMDITLDLTLNCNDNINHSVCINPANLSPRRKDDLDVDYISTLVNDETNETDGIEENPKDKTVFDLTVNCNEKALNEKFDADFSQFGSIQKNRSVLSTTNVTPHPIESVQKCEISTTSVHSDDTVFNENSDNEDDEFGDFSSFSPPTIAASSSAEMSTAIDHVSLNNSSNVSESNDSALNKSKTSCSLPKQESKQLQNLNDSNDTSSDNIVTKHFQQKTITTDSLTNLGTDENDKNASHCKDITYNLTAILSTLFPMNLADIDSEDDAKKYIKCSSTNHQSQFMNDLTIHLINVENAKALKHQWAKSMAKTFLVKSLGIDSRNILYGEKWNSSAPKFAANLGMSPLEPMKINTTISNDSSDNKSSSKTAADVPAAQFDWNSSGLINPLDGSRKSTHEERNQVPLDSPEQWNEKFHTNQELATITVSETPKATKISSPIIPEIETTKSIESNEAYADLDLNHNNNIESVQTSDSYNVPGSSGTMKETHIFTPNKTQPETDTEVSVDISSVMNKNSSDTERVVIIKENVVKKEYRDIEYDPERVISLDDFSDFQFVNTVNSIADEHKVLEPGQYLAIQPGSNDVIIDNMESNSAIVNTLSNCNGFEHTYAHNKLHSLPNKQTTQIQKVYELQNENYNQIENSKRIDDAMLVNNKNLHIDTSICLSADIQHITSQTYTDKKKIISNTPTMMLSNILKPQLISTLKPSVETSNKSSLSIEWPRPGIDTNQLMQLEQRFCTQPTTLTNGNSTVSNSSQKYSEDDEWSEFVSVEQPQTPITNIINKNLFRHQTDEDDWSEFVSSTLPMSTKRTTSSAHAPNNVIDSVKDAINNSWNCNEVSMSVSTKKPSSMYAVSMNQRTSFMVPPNSEAPSMISTLPDLRFVAPKSLVHMPNSSLMKK